MWFWFAFPWGVGGLKRYLYLYMYLLSICVSSLKKIFTSSAYFLILWFLPLSYIYSLHIWDTNPFSYIISKYFHPFSRLPFYFVSDFLLLCRNFLVWCSSTCFCCFCLWSPTQKKSSSRLMSSNIQPVFSSRIFMVASFAFFNPSELIFLYSER